MAAMAKEGVKRYCPRCFEAFEVGIEVCPDHGLKLIALEGNGEGLEGQVIDNKYQVIDVLGKGGMGTVYLARHMSIGREVALKVLRNDYLTDHQGVTRFVREARSASLLKSRYSAMLHDFGLAPQGFIYYTMELATGRLLSDIIDKEGALGPERTMHITADICHSLSEAHAHSLVHRDIKAANIMVSTDTDGHEFGKVLDFGTAKATETMGRSSRVTDPGIVCGTPEYMSPEQAQALPLDGRSDLYSLGVLMFEMLTGQLPFSAGNSVAVLMKHVNDVPPMLRTINPKLPPMRGLESLIGRLLAKTPEERPATALAVLRELRKHLEALAKVSGRGSSVDLNTDASFIVDKGVEEAFQYPRSDTAISADVPSTAPRQGPGPSPRNQNTMALNPGALWSGKSVGGSGLSLDEISSPTAVSRVVETVRFDDKGEVVPADAGKSGLLEEYAEKRPQRPKPSPEELSALQSSGEEQRFAGTDEFVPLESIGVVQDSDEFGGAAGSAEKLRALPSAVLKGVEAAAGRVRPDRSGVAKWVFAVGGVAIGAATLLALFLNGALGDRPRTVQHQGTGGKVKAAADVVTPAAEIVEAAMATDVRVGPASVDVVPVVESVAALLSEEDRALLERQEAALEGGRQTTADVVATSDMVDATPEPVPTALLADVRESRAAAQAEEVLASPPPPPPVVEEKKAKLPEPEVKPVLRPERKVQEKKKTHKKSKDSGEGGFNLDDLH